MNKILISLSVIGVVAAIAVGGTMAYFSDTVTSTGNSFTTGTLDLKVTNQDDPLVVHITRANLKPSASFTTNIGGQWVLKNTGSVPGTVTVIIKNLKDHENSCTDPEVKAGDATCGPGDDQGELGKGLINRVIWGLNQAPWGSLTPSFTKLSDAVGVPVTGAKYHLDPGQSVNAILSLYWDTSVNDNLGQGDSVDFDVEFTLNQDH